jgi:hypothetical protein
VVLLSFIALGTVDFGRVSYMAMALTNASRAGAMYGAQPFKNGDVSGMRNAAINSATTDIGAITVTPTRLCTCDAGATVDCTPPAVVPACGGTSRIRVKVIASKTFTMIKAFPGLPGTVSLSRTAIMRAQ